MPGKRPRTTMRRTSSVNFIKSGFLTEDCSPLPVHPKEKQKLSNIANPCPPASSIPPRKVIGFSPKTFTEEEPNHPVLSPTSPRPPQIKSNTGSIGSPRSGLGDLLAGSHPWERRDEGVGLGIVTALGSVASEDHIGANGVPPPVPAYTTRTSPQHLTSAFAPTNRISPSIPILSPRSNSPSSHHCPSSHRYSQNCAPQFRLSSALQESMTQDIRSSHHIIGPSGPVNNGGAIPTLSAWSQQAENMEVEAILPVVPSPIIPRPSYLPVWATELSFMDACFYCKRRLEEGRDIYMYRVDKAFCSPECRHKQIVIDERPEKCSQAVTKIEGGTESSRRSGQRSRGAGTAVAA